MTSLSRAARLALMSLPDLESLRCVDAQARTQRFSEAARSAAWSLRVLRGSALQA